MDNLDVAVYERINRLAQRFGLEPYDFTAQFAYDGNRLAKVLTLSCELRDDNRTKTGFDRMLAALGVDQTNQLVGSNSTIYHALERALRRVPQRGDRSL